MARLNLKRWDSDEAQLRRFEGGSLLAPKNADWFEKTAETRLSLLNQDSQCYNRTK